MVSSFRASNLPVMRPTTGIMKNDPMPRGAIAMPAWSDGIAEQRLQHDRQQHQAAVEHEPDHRHQEHADRVAAFLEHAQIDDRMLGAQFVNDQRHQRRRR